MDVFPFATTLLSADGTLRQANTRWAGEFPPLQNLIELLHPIDALRLRHAVRLKARLHLPVRLRRNGMWQNAYAFLSPQSESSALSLVLDTDTASTAAPIPVYGELLGGVVHSVNNYLSAMMGFSELALLDVEPTHPAYGQLQTVLDSGHQAVQFTRELLACAERAVLTRKPFTLNSWLRSQLERLGVPLSAHDSDCAIEADAEWLACVLDMAVTFLREGEPSVITAEFSINYLHDTAAAAFAVKAGRYGVLTLRDRGRGLDSKHLLPLFKPYYSSKTVRGRKGLGMAPVEGIARQHGGAAVALAEPGEGTALIVLLPLMSDGMTRDIDVTPSHRTAWFLSDLPWLSQLAQAQLASIGFSVAAITQEESQSLLADDVRPDLLLSWRLKDEGAAAALRQTANVPVVIWTPFAEHRPQTGAGVTTARFTPEGEHLRAAVAAMFKRA